MCATEDATKGCQLTSAKPPTPEPVLYEKGVRVLAGGCFHWMSSPCSMTGLLRHVLWRIAKAIQVMFVYAVHGLTCAAAPSCATACVHAGLLAHAACGYAVEEQLRNAGVLSIALQRRIS